MHMKACHQLLNTHMLLLKGENWEGQSVLISRPGMPCLGESHGLPSLDILWKCDQQPEREMSSTRKQSRN